MGAVFTIKLEVPPPMDMLQPIMELQVTILILLVSFSCSIINEQNCKWLGSAYFCNPDPCEQGWTEIGRSAYARTPDIFHGDNCWSGEKRFYCRSEVVKKDPKKVFLCDVLRRRRIRRSVNCFLSCTTINIAFLNCVYLRHL
ncbi:hypothetical protein PRIPAC_93808 [Pristionchus pacificus]|uniref:Uncharacterized protein n=1 Tax=Pristionchus pacificus TaxID=54126 RepID=A0A2A6CEA4_PRIPA|nr:hypothetical protein PRIPAC_93328 [Pristionchus pacificus]KAF8358813.1 hypothetical protein PRIPAC_93808 [Pristionchus pacificus]|eukprot:PDM76141.1 hypothetical protein PRIPAC_39745 [Pristionchus pacificus]